MEEALETLPCTLHEAFDVTVSQIQSLPEARKRLGIKSLMWIFYAKRQGFLRIADLREALAIREGQKEPNPRLRPTSQTIVSCCRGLVTVDKGTRHLRFIHQTVQEYIQSREDELFPSGEALVGEICLQYLLTAPIGSGSCDTEGQLLSRVTKVPFLWYAASCWGWHIQQSHKQETSERIMELLNSPARRSAVIQVHQYLRGYRELYWSAAETSKYTNLHMAACYGLQEATAKLLVAKDVEVDAMTCIGTTPLMIASSYGHLSIMHQLLNKGADPKKENWYGTSLHAAVEANQCEAIKLLFETGMDVHTNDSHRRTASTCAFEVNNVEAYWLLIEKSMEQNMRQYGRKINSSQQHAVPKHREE